MKKFYFIPVLISFFFGYACNSQPQNHDSGGESEIVESTESRVDVDEVEFIEEEFEEEEEEKVTVSEEKEEEDLSAFVPAGYVIMDKMKGDLNKDPVDDWVLVLKSEEEESDDFAELPRPMILLLGREIGGYVEAARNDKVVLCKACGGVFGDPWDGLAVKNGYFSAQHYGGSNWRWTRIITFKFDPSQGQWFLHKDGGDSYHTGDPDKVTTEVKTTADFGVVNFRDFAYESGE